MSPLPSALASVVDVVPASTDWAAVVAAIMTGVAAIAGIAGTYWQGKRARESASRDLTVSLAATADNLASSIRAEDLRGLRAEKIRVYSAFQGAIDEVVVAGSEDSEDENAMRRALTDMYKAAAAVTLIGPDLVGTAAHALVRAIAEESGSDRARSPMFDRDSVIQDGRQRLYGSMRADLAADEPAGLADSAEPQV
jgi:hypothetical protein